MIIRFIMILSEHLVRCDTDAVDFKNPWYVFKLLFGCRRVCLRKPEHL